MFKVAILSCFLLTGCVASTQQAGKVLQSKWIGKPADQFFVENGPPQSVFPMNDGGKLYTWAGGTGSVGIPGSASTTVIGNTATTNFSGGGTVHLGCTVTIATKNGTITAINPTGDSVGLWHHSRCVEIFGGEPWDR
jgi:hypothetical protein